MFSKLRDRLRRHEKWTPDELAEELWSMFSPGVPLEHSGPIKLYAQTGAPIIIENAQADDPLIRVVNKNSAADDDFSLYATQAGVNPNGPFQGTVVALLTGNIYTVSIYQVGPSDPPEDVSVTLLGGSVEAGESVVVNRDGNGEYFMFGSVSGQLYVPIAVGQTAAWAMPAAQTEFLADVWFRTVASLAPYTTARISVFVGNGGIAGSELAGQYSLDGGTTWTSLCSVTVAGVSAMRTGSLAVIPAEARTLVTLRVIGRGGNGTDTVRFGTVALHFR